MPAESAEPLSPQEIEDRLAGLPGWSLDDGRLTRSYRLGSHFAATAMVVHVAQVQEELDHHSDLTLGYNTVSVADPERTRGRRRHREGRRTGPQNRGLGARSPCTLRYMLDYDEEAGRYDASRGGEPRAAAAAQAVLT
ncbi:Putative pterin-4-alpha-carbinolamine dehydratase [Streptomyces hirsutus]